MKEVWKDIKEYEGMYQASDQGNVRSVDREVITINSQLRKYRGKRLKYSHTGREKNHRSVSLRKDNIPTSFTICCLVAELFLGKRKKGMKIIHKNGDFSDDRAINLKYATCSDVNYHNEIGKKVAVKKGVAVEQLDPKTGKVIASYNSGNEAYHFLSNSKKGNGKVIRACRTGGKCLGYNWRIKGKEEKGI